MKTYLHIAVILLLLVAGCAQTVDDRVEVVATPSLPELSAIDSLMWRQPYGGPGGVFSRWNSLVLE